MPDESLRNRAEAELRELGGSGAADDATCFNTNATSTAGIAACGELIASGKGTMSDRAKAYHWRGRHLRNDREYDRAIADFDEAIRLNPQDAVLIELL